jgi:hypothetical protein
VDETFPLSHRQAGGEAVAHEVSTSSVHGSADELCVNAAAVHVMQPPGSIFGLAGLKTNVDIMSTVAVFGVARFWQPAGTVPWLQLAVRHAVCAAAGSEPKTAAATTHANVSQILRELERATITTSVVIRRRFEGVMTHD